MDLDMKVRNLIIEINKKKNKWNERTNFTMRGIKNLSYSDLDTIILYAVTYAENGEFKGLMPPQGKIAEVLKKYEIGSDKIV